MNVHLVFYFVNLLWLIPLPAATTPAVSAFPARTTPAISALPAATSDGTGMSRDPKQPDVNALPAATSYGPGMSGDPNHPAVPALRAGAYGKVMPTDFRCNEKCGDVAIEFPFGIKYFCYSNEWFKVTCNTTSEGEKPFISSIGLEIVDSYTGYVDVKSPVTPINCRDEKGHNGSSAFASGNPFYLSETENIFGVLGCGNVVSFVNNKSEVVGGCRQPRCEDNSISNGCYAVIRKSENLLSVSANIQNCEDGSKRSAYSLVLSYYNELDFGNGILPDINNHSLQLTARLEWHTAACTSKAVQCLQPGRAHENSNCPEKCGNIHISYPFGIRDGCYKDEWYRVTCRRTENGPTPFMSKLNLQILLISFPYGNVRVNHPVSYSSCFKNGSNGVSNKLKGSPFFYSSLSNSFKAVGCGNLITIRNQTDLIARCMQPSCGDDVHSNNLTCVMRTPPDINSFYVNVTSYPHENDGSRQNKSSCSSAFLVVDDYDDEARQKSTMAVPAYLPVELTWAKPKTGLCKLKENNTCTSDENYCWKDLSSTYLCVCSKFDHLGYYSSDVCPERRTCKYPNYRYCHMLCLNLPNASCSTQCPPKYEYITSEDTCRLESAYHRTYPNQRSRERGIIIGFSTSFATIFALFFGWGTYKLQKKRKNKMLRQKYFKRNGGLLLQQQLSANGGSVDRVKLFTSKELEKATDYYNENRVLGRGGQGTVYKGMLADGSIVAVKKSKMVDEKKKILVEDKKLEQFINEVILVSQINHRNVVKLLGCCLETDFPLLVYEFIPNGTLSQLIEDQSDEFPLTWEMRLRIATEIGNALSYLHSAAAVPIYHRDIKSSNILLDEKYRAKMSDFGTSKSITLEKTHLTCTGVQGTFGYMDPEYFRSRQFTEKSDVYSFGVVLVEILTGKKPISSEQSEVRSLSHSFLLAMKENTLSDMLDSRVVNNGSEEEIVAVAKLAKRCLNLTGKKRPTMKQVAMELELIRNSEANVIQQSDDEDVDSDDTMDAWTTTDSRSTW